MPDDSLHLKVPIYIFIENAEVFTISKAQAKKIAHQVQTILTCNRGKIHQVQTSLTCTVDRCMSVCKRIPFYLFIMLLNAVISGRPDCMHSDKSMILDGTKV